MQTERTELENTIATAGGRRKADLVVKNARIVDVFNREVFEGNVAVAGKRIAGFVSGTFPAETVIDAKGAYLVPGLINGHVHIESSHCSPLEYAKLVLPCGTTTAVADPHEICNVCGIAGLDYMLKASEDVGMDIFYMFPSCVPATPFEHAGAVLSAEEVKQRINNPRVLGLGELMNVPGVVNGDPDVLDKIMACRHAGKHIDGHSPMISDSMIDPYFSALIISDHECETVVEMRQKIRRGVWIMLRQGSSCKNLLPLSKGITPGNIGRCLFCTDDKHPKSILAEGDIDNNVRMAINAGLDPLDAIRIATLNGAMCHRLYDRGAIAPGYKADFLLVDDLKTFIPHTVFSNGKLVAKDGRYLYPGKKVSPEGVDSCMNIAPISKESFALPLKGNKVRAIEVLPGGVVTGEFITEVQKDGNGNMLCSEENDICKIAVIERHRKTGLMSVAPLHNYGLRGGAIGTTIAHDSHNLIIVGDNDADMLLAAKTIEKMQGGQVIVKNGKVLNTFAHPIAGLMCGESGEYIAGKLTDMHKTALEELKINPDVDPLMTLSFMALSVIPKLKITETGLFDCSVFSFVPVEVE